MLAETALSRTLKAHLLIRRRPYRFSSRKQKRSVCLFAEDYSFNEINVRFPFELENSSWGPLDSLPNPAAIIKQLRNFSECLGKFRNQQPMNNLHQSSAIRLQLHLLGDNKQMKAKQVRS